MGNSYSQFGLRGRAPRGVAGSICSLPKAGFFGLVLQALRKACTGTLFDAGDVFAATDGLQKPGS